MKTGFSYLCKERPEIRAVVTAAADGQHAARDILKVARRLLEGVDGPVLGVRSFSGRVPLRSKLGNLATRSLFCFVTGVRLEDTQTGLRGLPRALLPELIEVDGDRYE